jgi:deoxyribonuclease V
MKIAIDVFYKDDTAKIVAAVFDHWPDQSPKEIVIKNKTPVAAYISGEFYKRELPCLSEIIADFELNEIDVIIIDGYVYLDNDGKPGLGAYLYEHLKGLGPVIGVAKTSFANNTKYVTEVCRGKSQQPLYITAIGVELNSAAQHIKSMYGEYRMPHILKLIDTETKK